MSTCLAACRSACLSSVWLLPLADEQYIMFVVSLPSSGRNYLAPALIGKGARGSRALECANIVLLLHVDQVGAVVVLLLFSQKV